MKIRLDFVTNSSSSTYYISKDLDIVFDKSERVYSFGCSKMDKITTDQFCPDIFSKYVNWHYLMKGTKPTVEKILSGKGVDAFAKYLITQKKENGPYYSVFTQKDYHVGYGESKGNDFELCDDYLISHLHPTLRRYFIDKKLYSVVVLSKKMDSDCIWIERNIVQGNPDGDAYYFRIISTYKDATARFYKLLYECAGSPELEFDKIEKEIIQSGLDVADVDALTGGSRKILYFANKTKKNDVVVFFDQLGEIALMPVPPIHQK